MREFTEEKIDNELKMERKKNNLKKMIMIMIKQIEKRNLQVAVRKEIL
jgi:hypothetical protein